LHKAQLEILSYEKVIKVLQEELNNMELRIHADGMKQRDYNDEQLQKRTENNWIRATSNTNRKSKVWNNNLIQLIPRAANKFEILTNLKEDGEMSCAAYKKEESSNVRCHQIKPKKRQIVKRPKKCR
jgi:hypothetical protein